MSGEYLTLAAVVLLVRALLCPRERPMGFGRFFLSTLLQVASLVVMEPDQGAVLAAAVIAAVSLGAFVHEAAGGGDDASRSLARFAAVVLLLVGLSFAGASRGSPVRFSGWAVRGAAELARASALLAKVDARAFRSALVILSGALFAATEVNNFTRYVLLRLKVAPAAAPAGGGGGEAQLGRGKMIGIVERLLIFYFVLTSNLSAIGFVLAAKGFTRFRELDDRDFAEYVLIGTLLSAAGAVLVGLLARLALDAL